MQPICLHDKHEIENFLKKHPAHHIYELGDLDDFFWPYTTWYASRDENQIQNVALLYSGTDYPVLLAFVESPDDQFRTFLHSIQPFLPTRFYSHLAPELASIFSDHYICDPHGEYFKMVLMEPEKLEEVNTARVEQFTLKDIADLESFYAVSYPGNWFDSRMLETGYYYGLRKEGRIISAAGIHVVSHHYGVAALGNITTHPEQRGKGYATAVTARLCQELLKAVPVIGLNVRANNDPAVFSYQHLGFRVVATYEEWAFERRFPAA